jgi:prepilin-type N-terminal cleavage/methylation domain-containing protein
VRGSRARWRSDEGGFTLVELLVTITITGIIMAATTATIISTLRVEQHERTLQDVIDDGRVSLQAIRAELRAARRIHEGSDARSLRFWVDQNQDQLATDAEQICYVVEPFQGIEGQWQVSRWTGATSAALCAPGISPPAGDRRVVASTLVDPDVFRSYSPALAGPDRPATREVSIVLELLVQEQRNLGSTTVESTIRLRNVP